MHTNNELYCPNCSHQYQLSGLSSKVKGNIPLLLLCGHSMCENCISNVVRIGEPNVCKICHRNIIINTTDETLAEDKTRLYRLFPVNVYILGELTLQHPEDSPEEQKVDGNVSQACGKSTGLRQGMQELIYISHIVDPHNFFVQRADDQNLIKEISKEFQNATSLPKPSSHLTKGELCLVYNKVDSMWQRCCVVKIDRSNADNPQVDVFCIDYGATLSVTIDSLRVVPSAKVRSQPPLAINCSLANCQPKFGGWKDDDSSIFQNIIDRKQALINVRCLKSTSRGQMKVQCDVTTLETGVSVAHALVFHNRAYMPDPKLKYPTVKCTMKNPELFTSYSDFKLKSVEQVFITRVTSPDNFYVRKVNLYEKLCEDMHREYSLNEGIPVHLPKQGMVYAVNLDRRQFGGVEWSRCVVRYLPSCDKVCVHLPDIGASTVVHWTALKYLPTKFTKLQALAVRCHLAGLVPLKEKWSPGSVSLLQNYEGRLLEVHVVDNQCQESIGVTLYDREDSGRVVCINNEMLKNNFALSFGTLTFNTEVEEHSLLDEAKADQVKIFKKESSLKKRVKKECPLKKVMKEDRPPNKLVEKRSPPIQIIKKDCKINVKGLEFKIIRYHSPSLIYVWFEQQREAFADLFKNMQKHYTKKIPLREYEWKVGDRCCAFCDRSKTWRRAVITQLDDGNARVCYVDFACPGNVSVDDLKVLVPEFDVYGDAAVKCHLSGVKSVDDEKWPWLTKEYFRKLLNSYKKSFIHKTGNIGNNSMPVEIWVYHTTEGGALDPDISEWRCLNKNIIEEGLALPDNSHTTTNYNEADDGEDNVLPISNTKYTVHDWLQLEPLPTNPMPKITKLNLENINCFTQGTVDMSNTILISDWLPPEQLDCQEFLATPIHIDESGHVYLHAVSQKDNLDTIREALDLVPKDINPKAKYANWTVGDPCLAMFSVDKQFYRGRIMEVNNENSTCLVHYIDNENRDVCSFSNLRRVSRIHKLYQIPVQSNKCILDRINLRQYELSKVLDYLRDCVIEKQCLVNVTGKPVRGVVPIELKVNNLCINDHLVECDMAKYSDSHEKVKKIYNTNGSFITYPKNEDEFTCEVILISGVNTFHLSIVHDNETDIIYEQLFKNIQEKAETMPPLNGIYENKACICIYNNDGLWYRASILQYDTNICKVKVLYVDYGNIEIVNLADIREISEDWTRLPPCTVMAKFYGVEIHPCVNTAFIVQEYTATLLEKGMFEAKIVGYENNIALLEKLKNEHGELMHEKLIRRGIFVKCKSTT